jgi:hypothetical protein
MLTIMISAFAGMISIITSLYIKSELERMINRRKNIFLLHIANVWISNIVTSSSYYIFSGMFSKVQGLKIIKEFLYVYLISLEFLLPIYVIMCIFFEEWKKTQKKYTISEDKKVLYIKEKYLSSKGSHYNSKSS